MNKSIPNNLTEIFTTQVIIKRVTEIKYLGLVLDENSVIMSTGNRLVIP